MSLLSTCRHSRRSICRGVLALTASLSILALSSAQAEEPFKVGFVYVGPVGDHGWTYRHDIGRQAIEAEFGDKVETTFVESVPEGADAERVIRNLASSGHGLIFTTSFGYMNPTLKVAKAFPEVKFEHATGYKRADNVSTYSGRFYEGRAVIGTMAGLMTQSNSVGYIGSYPIPEVVRGINEFTIAMRKVNPEATLKVVWVNSWYDPGKEADAAKTLIDQGVDLITQHTDSPAPLQVAQERGVLGFGQASDMAAFAPESQLTAVIDNWDAYYIERTRAAMEDSWTSTDTWDGIATGMVDFPEYGPGVPAEVVAAADEIRDGISDGSVHPFAGPIVDQAGNTVIADGEVIADEVLLGMDFYVEGVQGSLPK